MGISGESAHWRLDVAVAGACVCLYGLGVFWAYGIWCWSETGLAVDWTVIAHGLQIATQMFHRPVADCVLVAVLFLCAVWLRLEWKSVFWSAAVLVPAVGGLWAAGRLLQRGAGWNAVATFSRGWLWTTVPVGAIVAAVWAGYVWLRESGRIVSRP